MPDKNRMISTTSVAAVRKTIHFQKEFWFRFITSFHRNGLRQKRCDRPALKQG